MRKLYLALIVLMAFSIPLVIAESFLEDAPGYTGPKSDLGKSEPVQISGHEILNSNTEQTSCWTQDGKTYCNAIIHSAPKYVQDISGEWKNFTDVAKTDYRDDKFIITYKGRQLVFGLELSGDLNGKTSEKLSLDDNGVKAAMTSEGVIKKDESS